MELTKISFTRQDLIDAAKHELHEKWERDGDPAGPWGYYAIEESDPTEYKCCRALAEAIKSHLDDDLTFGFIQYFPEGHEARNGPLHLDVHKLNAIESESDRPQGSHIQRVLINLSTHPRKLKYLPCSRSDLEERGYDIPRDRYQPIDPPDDIEVQIKEIPSIEADHAWKLTFLGDDVPHAGYTDNGGQLLACFGKYVV